MFSKEERLCSRLLIEKLFNGDRSKSVMSFPLRAIFMTEERDDSCVRAKILVSVPKKNFKHAVDRNRVKRQVREAYRHHKQILTEKVQQAQTLAIAFIWLADECHESATVEKSVKRLLGKVADRL